MSPDDPRSKLPPPSARDMALLIGGFALAAVAAGLIVLLLVLALT